MKRIAISLLTMTSAAVVSAYSLPTVVDATFTQDSNSKIVTIAYGLSAPAVVTLDIETNAVVNGETVWASIGADVVLTVDASSDVWKKVDAGSRSITWNPLQTWPDRRLAAGDMRAVVTAWPLDNTPDYMVLDITSAAVAGSARYYPSADFVPGGVLANEDYRKTKLLMRKIRAKNVVWTMGSILEPGKGTFAVEGAHQAQLADDFYISVFEITQKQYTTVQSVARGCGFKKTGDMKPADQLTLGAVRCSTGSNTYAGTDANTLWPKAPYANSFLGILRTRTGFAFDLPFEGQWEFACRAGTSESQWNNGSAILASETDANLPGCYTKNAGGTTAVCGSYAPNAWGLYDMHGNVREMCLDWYEADISTLNGRINVDATTPYKTATGNATNNDSNMVVRGGSYSYCNANSCRSAARASCQPWNPNEQNGMRVVCPVKPMN